MKELNLLGLKVRDKVTGYTGIVTSITYDLYGCIQALVHKPCKDMSKQLSDCFWLDTNRLEIISKTPVMKSPHLTNIKISKGGQELPRKA